MEQSFLLSTPSPLPDGRPPALLPRPEAPRLASAAGFADPLAEAAALRTATGLLDLSDAGLVVVEGAEAAAFLHRLLANHVRALPAGGTNESLLLSAQGRVRFACALRRAGAESFALHTPPGIAADLARALEDYRFGEKLAIRDASDGTAPLALAGPGREAFAASIWGAGSAPEPGSSATLRLAGAALCAWRAAAGTPGAPALWLDAGPESVAELWRALVAAGAVPIGLEAREIVRLEAGVPLYGADVDADTYPQEAGLAGSFALDKGCYVGQEVVAKIDTYGGLKRRLAGWRLADARPVPRGTPVTDAEGAELGLVTSWVRSPRLASGLALGYVKLRALRGEPRWRIGGVEAELVSLPLA